MSVPPPRTAAAPVFPTSSPFSDYRNSSVMTASQFNDLYSDRARAYATASRFQHYPQQHHTCSRYSSPPRTYASYDPSARTASRFDSPPRTYSRYDSPPRTAAPYESYYRPAPTTASAFRAASPTPTTAAGYPSPVFPQSYGYLSRY